MPDFPETGPEATEEALSGGSLSSRMKSRAAREVTKTEKFVLLAPDEPDDLTIVVVARKTVETAALVQASRKSDSRFIVAVTDHVLIIDGKQTKTCDWREVHELMGLPEHVGIDAAVTAVVGGNETLVSDVGEDILRWMRSETDRAAAAMGL